MCKYQCVLSMWEWLRQVAFPDGNCKLEETDPVKIREQQSVGVVSAMKQAR